jgi:hypothetical protein
MFRRKKDLWRKVQPLFGFMVDTFKYTFAESFEGRMDRGEFISLVNSRLKFRFYRDAGKIYIVVSPSNDTKVAFDLHLIMHYINRECKNFCVIGPDSLQASV